MCVRWNIVRAIKQPAIVFILLFTALFYMWILLFKGNELLINIGFVLFSIVGGSVSCYWLFKSYRVIQTKQRSFWLWMGLGVLFYTIANIIWFFDQSVLTITDIFIDVADYFWIFSYLFFVIAFIFQARRLVTGVSIIPVLFNIVIIITIAFSIHVYYIMQPIIVHAVMTNEFTYTTLAYPIYNLGFLLAVISVYFLSYGSERKYITYIIIALIIQSIADGIYTYLTIIGNYDNASFIDPLWQLVILILGLASLSDRKRNVKESPKSTDIMKAQKSAMPYIGVVVLHALVIFHHFEHVNALNFGLSIAFLLIIARQIFVMRTNIKLIREYKTLAHHDTLTGLYNRWKFEEDFAALIKDAKENDRTVTLMLLDLDRFKYFNDTLGHRYGDRILIEFGKRLKRIIGNDGEVFRVGGDEFIVTYSDFSKEQSLNLMRNMKKELNRVLWIDEHEISITPSIGISVFPENGLEVDDLVNKADAAMYFSKETGKNSIQFYNDELNKRIARKRMLESSLKNAAANNELELFYQPQFELITGRLVGMEALIRWNHSELGLISPAEFIPIAERTGQIVPIGEWVLETACRQNKQWQEAGYRNLCVSVNVSVRQFRHNDFLQTVKRTLEKTGLDPSLLELEITESVTQDVEESIMILSKLREIGIIVSIDDFGTGYSSLYMLRQLPVDTIKIDKSFIDDIMDPANQSIVRTIISIGSDLNLKVIAEGIELDDQVSVLKQQGCSIGQGYLFSKPLPVEEFEVLLLEEKKFLLPML